MRGFFTFVLCTLAFLAGGWVAAPWMVDRAVDRFVERMSRDPQLASRVVTSVLNSPAFREAVSRELKKRGFEPDKFNAQEMKQGLQGLLDIFKNPAFQKYMANEMLKDQAGRGQALREPVERLRQGVGRIMSQVNDPHTRNRVRQEIDRLRGALGQG